MIENDLISRSALLKEVTKGFDAFIHGAYFHAACDAIRAKRAVVRMLNDALAVDAEPVRHGQWMNVQRPGSRLWCSECKRAAPWGVEHNYCPNCGAKMDGDGDARLAGRT